MPHALSCAHLNAVDFLIPLTLPHPVCACERTRNPITIPPLPAHAARGGGGRRRVRPRQPSHTLHPVPPGPDRRPPKAPPALAGRCHRAVVVNVVVAVIAGPRRQGHGRRRGGEHRHPRPVYHAGAGVSAAGLRRARRRCQLEGPVRWWKAECGPGVRVFRRLRFLPHNF